MCAPKALLSALAAAGFGVPGAQVGVAVAVAVGVRVGVRVAVAVAVAVRVAVGVAVLVGVEVAVDVGIAVAVGVAVRVGVEVAVAVGVLVGAGRVGTGVWVAVGVGVGVITVIFWTGTSEQLHFDGEPGKAPRVPGESGPVQSELSAFCFQLVHVETQACVGSFGHDSQVIVIIPVNGNAPEPTFVTSPQPSLSRFANGQDPETTSVQPVDVHGTVLTEHEPVSASPPSSAM